MNKKTIQTISALLSKIPKKDLEKNIEKIKVLLNNSNKDEIKNILSNPQVSKILGKDSEILKEKIYNINFNNINPDEIINNNLK